MPVSYFCFKSLSAPLFVWVTICKTFPLARDLLIHIVCPDFTEQLVGPILRALLEEAPLPQQRVQTPTQINHQSKPLSLHSFATLPHWNFFFNPLFYLDLASKQTSTVYVFVLLNNPLSLSESQFPHLRNNGLWSLSLNLELFWDHILSEIFIEV